jgi:hypothetical protein
MRYLGYAVRVLSAGTEIFSEDRKSSVTLTEENAVLDRKNSIVFVTVEQFKKMLTKVQVHRI